MKSTDRRARTSAPVRSTLMLGVTLLLLAGCASRAPTPATDERPAVTPEQQARWQEALILLESGDRDQARQRFEQLHRQAPQLSGPLVNLCVMNFEDDRTDEAEACFGQVLTLRPEHPVALTHLGVLARKAGEFERADALYRQALAADPDHAPAVLNLAILLDMYRGEPAEALTLYERYLSLIPEEDPTVQNWVIDLKNRL